MPDPAPNPELMRSLGRLVRGLSALFWGLPAALLVCFYTARADGYKIFGVLPPLASTALIVYGLLQLGSFQRQERIWRSALDRALILALITFGLSPFLYWWYRLPAHPFYTAMVVVLTAVALLLLTSINVVLQRLGAMLPDETLRLEIQQFTRLNVNLLLTTAVVAGAYYVLSQLKDPPLYLQAIFLVLDKGSFWLVVLLILLPLAMTMALVWKTKEVILDNIFGPKH